MSCGYGVSIISTLGASGFGETLDQDDFGSSCVGALSRGVLDGEIWERAGEEEEEEVDLAPCCVPLAAVDGVVVATAVDPS
jgi:hypothetical protein